MDEKQTGSAWRTENVQVAFYVTRKQYEAIRKAAAREERSVSQWVKRRVVRVMQREAQDAIANGQEGK